MKVKEEIYAPYSARDEFESYSSYRYKKVETIKAFEFLVTFLTKLKLEGKAVYGVTVNDNRICVSWSRKLTSEEKEKYKQKEKERKERNRQVEIKQIKKRAKELGII